MTVISEPIEDIGGADNKTNFEFSSAIVRENNAGTGLITRRPVFLVAEDGVLTTPDLDPGMATVRIGQRAYLIDIPDSGTPVRLWPLIEAGLPIPPEQEATAVINGGGVARVQAMTAAEYSDLTSSTTPDPGSTFFVY
ncbi:hypothetical protein OG874_00630 [Nocardia sp. NBC_00565]|uniref:hypothetical protein n=1 Tax=Nocardia sp. NBC_00565 TaxID=2975993 RepID=UPI002E7FC55B|nr:hypothetical protein [Nocardia sp. NBC_00565]WUC03761.1 hypothetical protein OG874_00630 [Nocardia sp. NBC_00565]